MRSTGHGAWFRVFALFALISMLLAACGGGNGAATTSPAGSAAGEANVAAPSVAASAATETSSAASAAGSASAETSQAASASSAAVTESSAAASASVGSASASAAGSAAAAPASSAAAGAGPTLNTDVSGNVELWHFWGSPVRRNAIRRVVAICSQKLPNIKITETFKPFGEMYTAHIAAVAAGSGMADVIVEDRPILPSRAAEDIDMNLQEFATRDGITGEAFWPFTWEQTLYEGDTYGIPYETDVRVLYYNKNAFKEVGLDPEKPPTTREELEQYADKLDKKDGDNIERMGFSPLIGNVGPDVWATTNGVELIDDQGQPHLNDPTFVETVEWVKSWIDRYGGWQNHQNFRANFSAPPNDEFMSGKVAMKVDINGYSSQLNAFRPRVKNAEGKDENLDWGVTDIPYKKEKGSTSGGFALSIPRGAKNVDPAWEFIKCATGPEAQASWARDTYSMPARVDAARDPVLLVDPNWQFFVDAMEYSSSGRYVAKYPNWGQELGNRYEMIWTNELEVQAALDEAQQAVEAEMGQ